MFWFTRQLESAAWMSGRKLPKAFSWLEAFPGFRERLELELEKLSPATKPRVHGSPYRYHASYLGATVHANSTAFKQSKLTRDEWIGASQRLPQSWNLS